MLNFDQTLVAKDGKISTLQAELDVLQDRFDRLETIHNTTTNSLAGALESLADTKQFNEEIQEKLHTTNKSRHEIEIALGE